MTTYAPSRTSKRVGNKRAPILNLCITPAEQYDFTLPTGGKSTQKERLQGTSGVEEFLTEFAKPQPSKVTALYNRPLPRLRSLLCLVQRSFPLRGRVVLNAAVLKDRVSDF